MRRLVPQVLSVRRAVSTATRVYGPVFMGSCQHVTAAFLRETRSIKSQDLGRRNGPAYRGTYQEITDFISEDAPMRPSTEVEGHLLDA